MHGYPYSYTRARVNVNAACLVVIWTQDEDVTEDEDEAEVSDAEQDVASAAAAKKRARGRRQRAGDDEVTISTTQIYDTAATDDQECRALVIFSRTARSMIGLTLTLIQPASKWMHWATL